LADGRGSDKTRHARNHEPQWIAPGAGTKSGGSMSARFPLLLLACMAAPGCREGARTNEHDDSGGDGDTTPDSTDGAQDGSTSADGTMDEPPDPDVVGPGGLRRLTIHEYDETIADLVGDTTRPARAFLPEDARLPFDNDRAAQVPSSALVDGAEMLAIDVAARLVADPQRRADVVGCDPPDDDCTAAFAARLGRRALRRTLADDEVADFVALAAYAEESGDPWLGIATIVGAMLQHPEFLYRVETGDAVADSPGLFRLRPHELVTRLSYLVVGTTPDDALLDLADLASVEGRAPSTAELREHAERLLDDPRARANVDRFHAMWLGYEVLPHAPELADPMRAETRALVDRVVFEERRPWADLLTSEETWLTAALAEHYGLAAPADPDGAWVDYGDSGRKGLLSHGTFLANGGAFGDTSPVMRGLAVSTRLLCQEIGPPPDDVNADDEPGTEGSCKWDRWAPHREPACVGCHGQFDPYGWGLEGYDAQGRFRELDDAGCELAPHTTVDVPDLGEFSGPGELGALVAEGDTVRQCLATQLLRYALGRAELTAEDQLFALALLEGRDAELALDELVLALVTTNAFGYRTEDPT